MNTKDIVNEISNEYAGELFKDVRSLPVDKNGEYVTKSDFAAVIAQAIDRYVERIRVE